MNLDNKPVPDNRIGRQMRTVASDFKTREASNDGEKELRIEGYFSVFDGKYDIAQGAYETVDEHAFDGALNGDVRALINHDTTLVLGRTTAHTLELKTDNHGLWGSILINPNDQDAMNLYSRVQRGDVDQCSFGFDITDEDTEILNNGDIHWTIKGLNLYEVSVCTFPAYETTEVAARSKDIQSIRAKELEAWKVRMADTHKWLNKEAKDEAQNITSEEEA